ncbi:AAA family ATPase [Thiorhodococcus minor]|uniref:AAA family ATPase n=1 Tax=Thiorhodococcus minor TaxID=57489 RepID=A0A6M0JVU5_9GAMM|nr:AAA family ATPase [Thiorhodococcus minor]NEV60733.1 AAA family ATPase [Thiorhodococcus minor]
MITIVASLKGGSGKSTLTFNLAVWLAMAEARVLLVDADPQCTLTDVAAVRKEERFDPILEVRGTSVLNEGQLRDADETLVDVGTADMESLRRAIALCDRVVVPVPPSQADIWSTQRFIKLISTIERDSPPEIVGLINRGDTHHAVQETNEAAAALVSLPGLRFIKPRLSQRTVFRRSFSEGLAVFELEPRGKAARELLSLTAALYPHLVG